MRSNPEENRILGVLTVCLSLVLLAGCASNESAMFKEAGCLAAEHWEYDVAARQFELAAENGDTDAVAASIASRQLWGAFMAAAAGLDGYGGERLNRLADQIEIFCGDEYDFR